MASQIMPFFPLNLIGVILITFSHSQIDQCWQADIHTALVLYC